MILDTAITTCELTEDDAKQMLMQQFRPSEHLFFLRNQSSWGRVVECESPSVFLVTC